jgi:NAD(P)H-hydrate epimerase
MYPLASASLQEPGFKLLDETDDGDFALSARAELREQMAVSSAMLIGCGLGMSKGAETLVLDCLLHAKCPLVLDADGINLAARHIDTVKAVNSPLILTPHPGEMARLTGLSIAEVQADRVGIARRFADETGTILVLKGHHTIIASPGQPARINTGGNPGMAVGGSGDVLAGMIASFLAQGMEPQVAAICGVYLHSAAGDKAAERLSQHYMLPGDIIDELSELFLILENRS